MVGCWRERAGRWWGTPSKWPVGNHSNILPCHMEKKQKGLQNSISSSVTNAQSSQECSICWYTMADDVALKCVGVSITVTVKEMAVITQAFQTRTTWQSNIIKSFAAFVLINVKPFKQKQGGTYITLLSLLL